MVTELLLDARHRHDCRAKSSIDVAGLTIRHRLRLLLLLLFIGSGQHAAAASDTPQIWLTPLGPQSQPVRGVTGEEDYFSLSENPAIWSITRQHVSVFKIYQSLLRDTPDDKLSEFFKFMRSANIKLALEYGMMTDSYVCGRGVEGFFGRYAAASATKIKRLGAVLDYLDMDEPLWYGSNYSGPKACHRSIATVAQDVAQHIAEVQKIFPNIEVGDTEPVPQTQVTNWRQQIDAWFDAFEHASGRPLSFFHADVIWSKPWQNSLVGIRGDARRYNVPFGIIYNGNPQEPSDAQYELDTLQHIAASERLVRKFDQVVFQTWQSNPTRVGPETTSGTLTNILLTYIRQKSLR